MKTDAERIEALLDLVDPERSPNPGNGPELQVLGLAEGSAKGGYSPTRAGWALLGDKGRVYRPR
jgi:hypothetical protein